MKRIDSLSDDQQAQMGPWADRWIDIGLSTDPIDVEAWEVHARRCYELVGIPWPEIVVRVESPFALVHAVPYTALVLEAIRSGRGDGQVHGQVLGQVHDQVLDQVLDQVHGQVHGQVARWANEHAWKLDRYWIGWLAWATYFRDVCGLELADEQWAKVATVEGVEGGAWAWWPQRDFVVVCDRPAEIHREQVAESGWASHRLHCEDGPAVRFRDGWSVWAIGGVRVSEQVVMRPETLTVDDVWAEDNTERRWVMIDRIGWDRFVEAAGLELIDDAPDPANPGERIRLYDVPSKVYDEPVVVALVTNASPERDGTRRRFGMTAPASCRTAIEAMAWTFGVDAETYRQLERAT